MKLTLKDNYSYTQVHSNRRKCKYIKAEGYDTVCSKKSVILGDIIGYDGQQCEKCEFYQPLNGGV